MSWDSLGPPIIEGLFLQYYALVIFPAGCMIVGFLRPRMAVPAFVVSMIITFSLWDYGSNFSNLLNMICTIGVIIWPYSMGDWRKEAIFIDYGWILAIKKKVIP